MDNHSLITQKISLKRQQNRSYYKNISGFTTGAADNFIQGSRLTSYPDSILAILAHASNNKTIRIEYVDATGRLNFLDLKNWEKKRQTSMTEIITAVANQTNHKKSELRYLRNKVVRVSGPDINDSHVRCFLRLLFCFKEALFNKKTCISLDEAIRQASGNDRSKFALAFTSLLLLERVHIFQASLSKDESSFNNVEIPNERLFRISKKDDSSFGCNSFAIEQLIEDPRFQRKDGSKLLLKAAFEYEIDLTRGAIYYFFTLLGAKKTGSFAPIKLQKSNNCQVLHPDSHSAKSMTLPAIRAYSLLTAIEPYAENPTIAIRRGADRDFRKSGLNPFKVISLESIISMVGRSSWLKDRKSRQVQDLLSELSTIFGDIYYSQSNIAVLFRHSKFFKYNLPVELTSHKYVVEAISQLNIKSAIGAKDSNDVRNRRKICPQSAQNIKMAQAIDNLMNIGYECGVESPQSAQNMSAIGANKEPKPVIDRGSAPIEAYIEDNIDNSSRKRVSKIECHIKNNFNLSEFGGGFSNFDTQRAKKKKGGNNLTKNGSVSPVFTRIKALQGKAPREVINNLLILTTKASEANVVHYLEKAEALFGSHH